jgi:hypothetical protein
MLLWNIHLNQLIAELSRACFVIGTFKSSMLTDTLITVSHAYFLSFMNYGLIFWGTLPTVHYFKERSQEIFPVLEIEIYADIISKNYKYSLSNLNIYYLILMFVVQNMN